MVKYTVNYSGSQTLTSVGGTSFPSAPTINSSMIKIGNLVTITLSEFSLSLNASTTYGVPTLSASSSFIPSEYRPTEKIQTRNRATLNVSPNYSDSFAILYPTGAVEYFNGGGLGSNVNARTFGFPSVSFSFVIFFYF